MVRAQQPALIIFSIGMIGLGILALIYGDFALVWQPVPAWVPDRTLLAYASGVFMILGGLGILFEKTVKWSSRIMFVYLIVWMMLKLPALFVTPQIEVVWLGFGELVVLMTGGWVLFIRFGGVREGSRLAFLAGSRTLRIVSLVFGFWLIPIGLSHFFYSKATIDLVPAWLPYKLGWAYLTGAGHIAAGLGILLSVLPGAAALAEAAMLSTFTIWVWLPAIFAAPRTRLPWTAFFISWAITSGAWLVATNMTSKMNLEEVQTATAANSAC
jgi:uncharacterized membrane protein